MQSEYLAELKSQIEGPESQVALDLKEVTLVDIGVVRFLLVCEESGIELLHCSPSIRQWMIRERPGQRWMYEHAKKAGVDRGGLALGR